MINLDCAKNLLDMWVLMLQNQWKKNEKKSLSQFWENHNFVNFPSIEAKQFMEQPKQSSFALWSPCHIIPSYLLNWPISYNSIKLCNIISYVIEGDPE